MKKNKNTESELLRQQAEALLKKNARKTSATLSEIDMLSLIHELEVHQIELELQNDELQRAKELADLATDKYTDLYQFAPSGYLMLSKNGDIVELNLESAKMLGNDRSKLMNKSFGLFVSSDTRSLFNQFLGNAFEGKRQESCEVALSKDSDITTYVLLSGILAENKELCNVTIVDITERKQAENELIQSEKEYRDLFNNASDAIYIQDKEGRFLDINQGAVDMYGYPKEFFIGKTPELLSAPGKNDLNKILGFVDDAFNGKPRQFDFWGIRKNGEIFPIIARAQKGIYKGKTVVITFALDITERKQAEKDILDEKSLLEAIIDNIPVMITHYNPEAQMLYLNKQFEEIIGWRTEEVQEIDMMKEVYPDPDYRQEAFEYMQMASQEWREFQVRSKSGKRIDSEWSNLRLENGTQIGIGIDITERKQAEETLRESEEKHRTLFETMTQGVVYQDADGKIISANTSAERILGLTFDQMQGRSSVDPRWKSIHEDGSDFPGETHPSMISLKTGQTVSNTIMGIFHPGKEETRWMSINATPQFKPEKKKPYQVYTTFEDITERKQAEEAKKQLETQLRQSQKLEAVGTMVGGISHELNNILQSMFLYGGMVKDNLPEDNELRANFEQMLIDGERAKNIVKQILTFSRKSSADMQQQEMHELVREALALERVSLPANIELNQDIDTDCGLVLCDSTQVHQIILNLCNNAQHAMEESGGVLTVSLKQVRESMNNIDPETDALELKVTDAGHGIDTEDLGNIFDPFFTTKQFGKGTGLGLSVIYGIVEMMNGHISVTSEMGKGTTFRILFPVTEVAQQENFNNSAEYADVKRLSILLVDDEDGIRDAAQFVLGEKGHIVVGAPDGKQALALFKANPGKYDLIVTDQSMPKMSGVELTKAIRSTNSEIPIILSTGQLGAQNEKEFKDIGITAFIQKPWTTEELIERIRGLDTL